MRIRDRSLPEAGTPVVIYDRRDCGAVLGLGVQERVAACYRWASTRGHVVLDRFVSWDGMGTTLPAALSRALDLCSTGAACLLVYTEQCLSDDPTVCDAVVGHLSGRATLTVVSERRDWPCAVAP
jgi:hypothetical protein